MRESVGGWKGGREGGSERLRVNGVGEVPIK